MAECKEFQLPLLRELQSPEHVEVLDAIDSLRVCGLSEVVTFPQIVVWGYQSSGKSSVLEAISGIPFPKQDALGTRFATEVILRRATKIEASASIVPSGDRALIDRDRLLQFHRRLNTIDDFEDLFKSAGVEMELSSSEISFSNDILRIQICGPSQPQLTIIDLPGYMRPEAESQTASYLTLVHNLVSRYLEDPRSIILVVVSATSYLKNRKIPRNAQVVDPQSQRTFGVITKPDLLVKGSKGEDEVIEFARNQNMTSSLGWYIVKNPDSTVAQNQQDDTRDQQETLFFQNTSFERLLSDRLGIAYLRERLSIALFNHIRRELPRLLEVVRTEVTTAKTALEKLGPARDKPDEQRQFLITLSETFQTICRDAVRGDYDHEFFRIDSNPERRLRAVVMNMHLDFACNIRATGASWFFGDQRLVEEPSRSRNEAIIEVCKLLKRSRGRALPGRPNPLVVGELFRQYSRPWGNIARLHIKKVGETTCRFLELLLQNLANEDVCENILRHWIHPSMERKLTFAYSKLDELLEVHQDLPTTTNHRFVDYSEIIRRDSGSGDSESMPRSQMGLGTDPTVVETAVISSLSEENTDVEIGLTVAEELFDDANMYYEVALDLFTDNVPTLAIQGPILRELPKTFYPTAVYSMDAELVHRIAVEKQEGIVRRNLILRRLTALENGASNCTRYAKPPRYISRLSLGETTSSVIWSAVHNRSGKDDKTTTSVPTRATFSPPTPALGNRRNLFSPTTIPSKIVIGSPSGTPLTFTLQNDKTPSTNPKDVGSTPTPGSREATKLKEPESVSNKVTSGLSESKNGPASATVARRPSPGLFGGYNPFTTSGRGSESPVSDTGERKPGFSGTYSTPTPATGNNHQTGATAKPTPATSIFSTSNPKPSTSSVQNSSAPISGSGSASSATKPNSSMLSSGAFTGFAVAKNENSLKCV